MATDYERIARENQEEYGRATHKTVGRFADLYSHRGHFIFELLQNAEDAGASVIRFGLYPDRLEVRHDGRAFDERDVRGVCGIDEGTKAGDRTKIGKFGLGFKSVYNYTSSPEIHSGDEHFRIERYVLPRAVPPRPLAPSETLFVFPFGPANDPLSRERAGAGQAFAEIGSCLQGLGPRTLLFLDHLIEARWTIAGGPSGSYLREVRPEGEGKRIAVVSESGGVTQDEEWLVFERGVVYDDEHLLAVQVAYLLAGNRGEEPIVGAPNCPLVVFFPTAQRTNLQFLVQGPYNTTPARDNVREDDLNRFLVEETARLVAWTLPRLRDMGLLSVSLLQALPIREQDFPPGDPFRPIYDAVREAFCQQELLPAHGGGFVRQQHARLADGPLRQLVSEEQLRRLYGTKEPLRWLSDQITLNRTADLYRYLQTVLDVPEIAPIDFVRTLSQEFLARQSDAWMIDLYAFLGRQQLSGPLLTLLRQKPIIRLEDGTQVAAYSEAGALQAYLPAGATTSFPAVKQAIAADERARAFLVHLHLKEPDLVDEVLDRVLPKYDGGSPPTQDEALRADVDLVLQAIASMASPRQRELRSRLERTRLIRTVLASGAEPDIEGFPEEGFKQPNQVFFRSPELELYFRGDAVAGVFPHPCYQPLGERIIMLGFRRDLRPSFRGPDGYGYVTVEDSYGSHFRGVSRFDPKATLYHLALVLDTAQSDGRWPEVASFIWNAIAVPYSFLLSGTVEFSATQGFKHPKREECYSDFGGRLANAAWLPDRSGVLHRPDELTLDDLPDGFQRDEAVAQRLGMKSSVIRQFAEESGVDVQVLQALQRNPEQARAALQQAGLLGPAGDGRRDGPDPDADGHLDYAAELGAAFARDGQVAGIDDAPLPGVVPNPALRRERTEAEIRAGVAQEPEREARHRYAPRCVWEERNGEVRAFLHAQYRGICQICQTAPFPRRDGEPYFTGVYLVSATKARWLDRPGNALCLCPSCCARFVFGSVEADNIVERIRASRMLKEGGQAPFGVPVTLCGHSEMIRFSERHMLDLQSLLAIGAEVAVGA